MFGLKGLTHNIIHLYNQSAQFLSCSYRMSFVNIKSFFKPISTTVSDPATSPDKSQQPAPLIFSLLQTVLLVTFIKGPVQSRSYLGAG